MAPRGARRSDDDGSIRDARITRTAAPIGRRRSTAWFANPAGALATRARIPVAIGATAAHAHLAAATARAPLALQPGTGVSRTRTTTGPLHPGAQRRVTEQHSPQHRPRSPLALLAAPALLAALARLAALALLALLAALARLARLAALARLLAILTALALPRRLPAGAICGPRVLVHRAQALLQFLDAPLQPLATATLVAIVAGPRRLGLFCSLRPLESAPSLRRHCHGHRSRQHHRHRHQEASSHRIHSVLLVGRLQRRRCDSPTCGPWRYTVPDDG